MNNANKNSTVANLERFIGGNYHKMDPIHGTDEYESRGEIIDVEVSDEKIKIFIGSKGWSDTVANYDDNARVTEVVKLEMME